MKNGLIIEKSPKVRNRSRILAAKFGGKWTYCQAAVAWYCNDGKRIVRPVASGVGDGEQSMYPPNWYLYGDGIPRSLNFTRNSVSVYR